MTIASLQHCRWDKNTSLTGALHCITIQLYVRLCEPLYTLYFVSTGVKNWQLYPNNSFSNVEIPRRGFVTLYRISADPSYCTKLSISKAIMKHMLAKFHTNLWALCRFHQLYSIATTPLNLNFASSIHYKNCIFR